MKIDKSGVYAIVTGDVIASSKLPDASRRLLHQAMRDASKAVRAAFGRAAPLNVDIFRGDGWQLLVTDPSRALRASLLYRAHLRSRMESDSVDTRMVIAIGAIDFIPGKRVTEGDGPAYRLSGSALETMSRTENMRFVLPGMPEETALNIMVQLVDWIASRWSDKQALAVSGALRGWKQDRIAKTCWPEPISQQAVAQHLERAGWNSIELVLTFSEDSIVRFLSKQQPGSIESIDNTPQSL